MRVGLGLVIAAMIAGAANAQAPKLIERFDLEQVRAIALSAGFKAAAAKPDITFEIVDPKNVPPGRYVRGADGKWRSEGGGVEFRDARGNTFWSASSEAFEPVGGGATFRILPTDCVSDTKIDCGAIMLHSVVPLPKGVDALSFLEVFNNTNLSVKLYVRGSTLVCDRYVQLAGGVTEAYLRQAIKSYAEAAATLVEDKGK